MIRFFVVLALCAKLSSALPKSQQFINCMSPAIVTIRPGTESYGALLSRGYVTKRGWPVVCVSARNTSEVALAVRCARKASLKVCARSGGHAYDGRSRCNGGVLIDLALLNNVQVGKNGVASVGSGAILGETIYKLHDAGRWFAAGVCPAVGMGGYLLGGGHGPYEGRLGVACDSLVSATMVTRDGDVIQASKWERQGLFWGLCGGGGAQFGIVTEFRLTTAASKPFDNAVIFMYRWPHERIGELLASWTRYNESGGNVWVRVNMSDRRKTNPGIRVLGACYDVRSTAECEARLRKGAFFHTAGRSRVVLSKVRNALEVQAFIGPGGAWGQRYPTNIWESLVPQRDSMNAMGNRVTDQSAFLTLPTGSRRPTAAFWQRYADYCADAPLASKPWRTCQMNLFQGAVNKKVWNAFPHRDAHIIAHFIVGSGTESDRKAAYWWMRKLMTPYTSGVYVNYQESALGAKYANLYWGKHLTQLRKLKALYDPNLFFANPQPIPAAAAV